MWRGLCFKNLVSTDYSHTVNLTKKAPLNEMPFMFLFLSLLSDSNQRPRDYKSRALAN